MTTVCACEKTVVMAKQPNKPTFENPMAREETKRNSPGHFTSMKYEFGDCTRRLSLCERFSDSGNGLRRSMASGWNARSHDDGKRARNLDELVSADFRAIRLDAHHVEWMLEAAFAQSVLFGTAGRRTPRGRQEGKEGSSVNNKVQAVSSELEFLGTVLGHACGAVTESFLDIQYIPLFFKSFC
jgi:hypothetical protein